MTLPDPETLAPEVAEAPAQRRAWRARLERTFEQVRAHAGGRLVVAALALAVALSIEIVLRWSMHHRLVDDDEGYLLVAAWRAVHGAIPYRDFFYAQMPLQPYVYGGWMRLFGYGLRSGRELTLLLVALTGAFTFLAARRLTGRIPLALVAAALFATAIDVREWMTVVKTFELAACLGMASLWALTVFGDAPERARWLVASGALAAAAVATRATWAPLVPLFGGAAVWVAPRGRRWRAALLFCAGASIVLLPVLALAASTPRAFLWDNLRCHLLTHGAAPHARFLARLKEAKSAFALDQAHYVHNETDGAQRLVLAIAWLALLGASLRRRARPIDLALLGAGLAAFWTAYLLYPPNPQYYVQVEPWALLPPVLLADRLALSRRAAVSLLAALCIPYLFAYASPGGRTLRWHSRDVWFSKKDVLTEREALAHAIDRAVPRGDHGMTLTNFPLDLVGTSLVPLPEAIENAGALAADLDLADRRAYRTLNDADAAALLAHHVPSVVLVDSVEGIGIKAPRLLAEASKAGYRKVFVRDKITVFYRRSR